MKHWWIKLGRYGLSQWRGLLLIVSLILAAVGVDVIRPWPLKLIVDNVLKNEPLPVQVAWLHALPGAQSSTGLLLWLTLATIVLFLTGWLFRMAQQYLQTGVGARMVYALSADLFLHLQRLSLRFHGQQQTGDLVKRVTTDTDCVRQLVLNAGLPLVTSLFTLTSMIGIMWQLDPRLAVVALLVAPLLGVCIWIFAGPLNRRSFAFYELQGAVTARAEQVLTALPLVRAFGQEEREDRQFGALWRQSDQAYLRLNASQLQFKLGTGTVSALGTAVVLVVGGYQVLGGRLSIGSLVVFLSYVASLYAPLETLAYLSSSLSAASAGARRVFEVFERDVEVRDLPSSRPTPRPYQRPRSRRREEADSPSPGEDAASTAPSERADAELRLLTSAATTTGRIRFEHVTFGYTEAAPVLRDINLEAHPGETIALVGPTGAGKSTLVSLIPRLFDPWEGRVTLDGVDLRELRLASLRAQISIVLQDPFLLPLTIAENIAYGRPDATRDQIIQSAMAANADEFIRKLPQGYDTVISERGATLSGGQRQRLSIARALLKDAPILILDEPTSAMDVQTEALFLEALYRLIQGRTTFIIAHRLSTVQRATRIVVLEKGQISDVGTHEELKARAGLYQRLAELQIQGGVL